jgi:dihydropteroate synthase
MRKKIPNILRCRHFEFDLSKKTYVMGVLNITPDSFSDGGKFLDADSACQRALEIEGQGADIIDIGGESSRPGSTPVSAKEEIRRVVPVLKRLKKLLNIPISIDTTKSVVAEAALSEGASIVNDISGLHKDKGIADLCAKYSAGLIIMHMKGEPRTMQKRPSYKNLLKEIREYLGQGIKIATSYGVKRESIIIDPGIGFGKTLNHNIRILKELSYFKNMGPAILVGLSRKSFMGKLLGLDVGKRLVPTIAANSIAIYNGANIIRVHDVKEAVLTANMVDAIIRSP